MDDVGGDVGYWIGLVRNVGDDGTGEVDLIFGDRWMDNGSPRKLVGGVLLYAIDDRKSYIDDHVTDKQSSF